MATNVAATASQQMIILSKHKDQMWSLENYFVDTLWLKYHFFFKKKNFFFPLREFTTLDFTLEKTLKKKKKSHLGISKK